MKHRFNLWHDFIVTIQIGYGQFSIGIQGK